MSLSYEEDTGTVTVRKPKTNLDLIYAKVKNQMLKKDPPSEEPVQKNEILEFSLGQPSSNDLDTNSPRSRQSDDWISKALGRRPQQRVSPQKFQERTYQRWEEKKQRQEDSLIAKMREKSLKELSEIRPNPEINASSRTVKVPPIEKRAAEHMKRKQQWAEEGVKAREKKEEEELKECTFTPRLLTSRRANVTPRYLMKPASRTPSKSPTFQPAVDKNSTKLFKKSALAKEKVEDRCLKSLEVKKEKVKALIDEMTPKFRPEMKSRRTKTALGGSESFGTSFRSDCGRSLQSNELLASLYRKDKSNKNLRLDDSMDFQASVEVSPSKVISTREYYSAKK
eukprot:TRINITY_DN13759_c0_g1_i2.p1 TRINITY_DN13759_c0_g1~~TRINITY_DN13759_c0_g1_i2.p1  ORF type:complete len:339 (+),score=64.04 TRINITY_DN13759_c0_g1_i2:140-1156(+)